MFEHRLSQMIEQPWFLQVFLHGGLVPRRSQDGPKTAPRQPLIRFFCHLTSNLPPTCLQDAIFLAKLPPRWRPDASSTPTATSTSTDNRQHTTDNRQQTADNTQHTTNNRQQTTDNRQQQQQQQQQQQKQQQHQHQYRPQRHQLKNRL